MSLSNILYLIWIVVIVIDIVQQRKQSKQNLVFLNKKIEILENREHFLMTLVDIEREKVKILIHAIRFEREVDLEKIDEAGIGD